MCRRAILTVAAFPGSPEKILAMGSKGTARMEGSNLSVPFLYGRVEEILDTGGLISAALLSAGGASAYFRGGTDVYTAYARSGFLDIPDPLPVPIERASTKPYASLVAENLG
jgi:hypothetical protein